MHSISLNKLHHTSRKPSETQEEVVISHARGFTRILTNILCSSTFKHHMRVITMEGKYLQYLFAHGTSREAYQTFGQCYRISNKVTTEDVVGEDPGLQIGLEVCSFSE